MDLQITAALQSFINAHAHTVLPALCGAVEDWEARSRGCGFRAP
jgi:hypothetical protein